MTEESNQFPMKVMTLSVEILTILYSRDLTHEELVQFRKRFSDLFAEYQKAHFSNYPPEAVQHIESKIKNELIHFNENVEKERKERIAVVNGKVCCACQTRTLEFKEGNTPEEVYCMNCSVKYLKPEMSSGLIMEQPVN